MGDRSLPALILAEELKVIKGKRLRIKAFFRLPAREKINNQAENFVDQVVGFFIFEMGSSPNQKKKHAQRRKKPLATE